MANPLANPLDNVVIDGDENGSMQADGANPPFALFSPDLQENIGGPYAKRQHAADALELMKQGIIHPYHSSFASAQAWQELGGN